MTARNNLTVYSPLPLPHPDVVDVVVAVHERQVPGDRSGLGVSGGVIWFWGAGVEFSSVL